MGKKIRLFLLLLTLLLPSTILAQDLILKVGDIPPKLDFKRLNRTSPDEIITWESFKNQVVIIDFWATWCPPCRKAIPHLNKFVKEFKGKPVSFISITYEPDNMIKSFLEKYKLDTMIGIDNRFAMFKSFKAWGIPMVVIVNQKGRIASVIHPNYLNRAVIEEVLAGKVPEVKQHDGWPDPEGAEEYFRSLLKTDH